MLYSVGFQVLGMLVPADLLHHVFALPELSALTAAWSGCEHTARHAERTKLTSDVYAIPVDLNGSSCATD